MAAPFTTTNWIDEPGVTFTPVIGTMSRPYSELTKPWGRGLARGTYGGIATIVFDVDLGQDRTILTLGALGINGEHGTQFRLTSDGGAAGDVLATTSVGYMDGWGFPFGPACWLHAPGGVPWFARYVRVRIDVSGATWVDLRRLWVGNGVAITGGVNRQFSIDLVDGSASERTARGGVFTDQEGRWRRIKFAATNRTDTTMLGAGANEGLWPRLVHAGRSREAVIAVRTNELTDGSQDQARYLQTVLGQVTEWTPLLSTSGNRWGIESITVEEAPMLALS